MDKGIHGYLVCKYHLRVCSTSFSYTLFFKPHYPEAPAGTAAHHNELLNSSEIMSDSSLADLSLYLVSRLLYVCMYKRGRILHNALFICLDVCEWAHLNSPGSRSFLRMVDRSSRSSFEQPVEYLLTLATILASARPLAGVSKRYLQIVVRAQGY
jgi:hypothetical protein